MRKRSLAFCMLFGDRAHQIPASLEMDRSDANTTTPCKPQRKGGLSWRFGTIVGLQFLTEAAFGFMSPIISILMTEYFARQHRDGLPIDCGVHPHDEACTQGSREAAWLYSLFASLGAVFNFILAPMFGQASDVYGRKPFLVLSQLARVGTPFSIMYFMQPGGVIAPYLVLRLIDYGFGTAGVMSAAVADIVAPEHRAAAFGILFASISVGYCMCAFVAPFFARITAALFVARVLWAVFILPETLPVRKHVIKTRWVVESPVSAMSILFRNKLFMRLTCIVALTSFAKTGIFQIQSFYLNTIVAFDVKDFGNLMLLGGVLSLLGQGILLKPLVSCFKEKGVIIIALTACVMKMSGLAGTAFYPHKWVAYVVNLPGTFCDLSFTAISALKSNNVSEKEQGRLQGAIYGARSVFDALGPVVFSSLYSAMTRQSVWSQALPFVVAACIYFIGVIVAASLPVAKVSSPSKIASMPAPLPSPTSGESPASSSMYFESDNDTSDIEASNSMVFDSNPMLNEDQSLAEPLLGDNSLV